MSDPAQQGVRTGGQAQRPRQPRTGLATEGLPDEPKRLVEAGRRARGDGGNLGEPFSKGLPWAIGRQAEEPADLQLDADRSALPGQVGERPGVPAVDARGKLPALGAGTGG